MIVTPGPLNEKLIFVVEDEFLLAEELCRGLEDVGGIVIGPAPSVERALALIAAQPAIDVAVLDVNLGGEKAYPVAEALLARSVPFVFTSGYDDHALDQRYTRIPRCQKPAEFRTLAQALAKALSG